MTRRGDGRSIKVYDEPSVFTPANLLREARRQRHLGARLVPAVCLLDPDGDVVRHLVAAGAARRHDDWACYHSDLWSSEVDGHEVDIVPCAVGGPTPSWSPSRWPNPDAGCSSP